MEKSIFIYGTSAALRFTMSTIRWEQRVRVRVVVQQSQGRRGLLKLGVGLKRHEEKAAGNLLIKNPHTWTMAKRNCMDGKHERFSHSHCATSKKLAGAFSVEELEDMERSKLKVSIESAVHAGLCPNTFREDKWSQMIGKRLMRFFAGWTEKKICRDEIKRPSRMGSSTFLSRARFINAERIF